MIVYSGELYRHLAMMHTIGHEVLTIRSPETLSERGGPGRKPTMTLLPYAIPIAVGSDRFLRVVRSALTRRALSAPTRPALNESEI